jgi:hypothetical protein
VRIVNLPHIDRLAKIKWIFNDLGKTAPFSVRTKKFFGLNPRESGNVANNIRECLKYISTEYKDGDNDGLIFTSVEKYFGNPILKWKYPKFMSIDFFINQTVTHDNEAMYDVFVYDKTDNMFILRNLLNL